jgi:hypothetical protein
MLLTIAWLGAAQACQGEALIAARDAIASSPTPELQRTALARALVQACTFKPRIADMLGALPGASAADVKRYDLKAAEDALDSWAAACPGGAETLAKAKAQSGAARQRVLWNECRVERFRIGSEGDWLGADAAVYLAVLVGKHFEEQRVHESVGAPILRVLAGVGVGEATSSGSSGPWAQARAAADAVADLYWDQLDEPGWAAKATELVGLCDQLRTRPAAERRDGRQTEFDTCLQAGRAAENANMQDAPFYRDVNGTQVNWGFYLAALVAKGEPMLLTLLQDDKLKQSVQWHVGQVDAGKLPVAPP